MNLARETVANNPLTIYINKVLSVKNKLKKHLSYYDLKVYDGNVVGVRVDCGRLSQLGPRQLETDQQTEGESQHHPNTTWSRLASLRHLWVSHVNVL